jgi:TPP-dependent pyruvate/acetoin dehydrogenase alpha subunit
MNQNNLIEFESNISKLWKEGVLPFLIHLSGGNERQLIDIFKDVLPGDWILSSHRNHYHYLLAGGTDVDLEQKIRDGKSMFVFNAKINFLSSSILGGMCGIAAGIAKAIKIKGGTGNVWCFLGDGAEDNGHLYEAVKFVTSSRLPCKFVIEDNDRSVTVNKSDRRSQFNVSWPSCVIRYCYTPTFPHAGDGSKTTIKFDESISRKHSK